MLILLLSRLSVILTPKYTPVSNIIHHTTLPLIIIDFTATRCYGAVTERCLPGCSTAARADARAYGAIRGSTTLSIAASLSSRTRRVVDPSVILIAFNSILSLPFLSMVEPAIDPSIKFQHSLHYWSTTQTDSV